MDYKIHVKSGQAACLNYFTFNYFFLPVIGPKISPTPPIAKIVMNTTINKKLQSNNDSGKSALPFKRLTAFAPRIAPV